MILINSYTIDFSILFGGLSKIQKSTNLPIENMILSTLKTRKRHFLRKPSIKAQVALVELHSSHNVVVSELIRLGFFFLCVE